MKRVFACIAMLAVLVSLCVPAFAAEADFTPSVPNKPAPEIVPGKDDAGNDVVGVIRDKDGNVVDYIEEGCLVITPVADVDKSTDIPKEAAELLKKVHDELNKGTMKMPYDKFGDELKNKKMVIRDLFDASLICGEHPPVLAVDGNTLEVTFDLGINKGVEVYVMTYVNGEWVPIVDSVNNGDGTITCTFEEICPIAFSVVEGALTPPTVTGDMPVDAKWFIIGGIALAAIVALTVVFVIDSKKHAAR